MDSRGCSPRRPEGSISAIRPFGRGPPTPDHVSVNPLASAAGELGCNLRRGCASSGRMSLARIENRWAGAEEGPGPAASTTGGSAAPDLAPLAEALGGRGSRRLMEELLQAVGEDGLLGPGADAALVGLGASAAQRRRFRAAATLASRLLPGHRDPLRAGAELRPSTAARRLLLETCGLEVETFWVLLLDGRHRLTMLRRVSMGTLTASLVHPREVFREAIRSGAAALAVGHNHPSGDAEPSVEDWAVTQRLHEAGTLLGIPLVDHLVVGGRSWVSLRVRPGWPRGPGRGARPRPPPQCSS